MARMTLRLPETLHAQLVEQAEAEGVSLNQYIVYALSRQTAPGSADLAQPTAAVKEAQAVYETHNRPQPIKGMTNPTGAAKRKTIDPEKFLAETEHIREKTAAFPLTDELLEKLINTGRP